MSNTTQNTNPVGEKTVPTDTENINPVGEKATSTDTENTTSVGEEKPKIPECKIKSEHFKDKKKILGIGMTESEYRTNPAISRSELWKMSVSPQAFKYFKDFPQEPTDALIFGQAFHKLVLEYDDFYSDFDFEPPVDKRTKEGKSIYESWKIRAEGKTILKRDTLDTMMRMLDAIEQEPFAVRLLSGLHERSFFWTDADTGIVCKCRTDNLYKGKNGLVIADLKTCQDASEQGFSREVFKYGYDFQAAMYSAGVEAVTGYKPTFVFIAVEKKPPYSVNVVQLSPEVLNHGYDTFRTLLGQYKECTETNNWYGHLGQNHIISTVQLPTWLGGSYED